MNAVAVLSVMLVQGAEGRWEPGIGDPTLMGWLTVFAYFGAVWACFRAHKRARLVAPGSPLAYAWLAFTVGMVLLGINKQLDLQSLLTEIGRDMAFEQGWYENRHEVQVRFIKWIAVLGFVGLVASAWWLRRYVAELWLAGLGAVFIVVFVIVRASSFHHVDVLLSSDVGGARLNWVFELGGIACVAFGARKYARRPIKRRKVTR